MIRKVQNSTSWKIALYVLGLIALVSVALMLLSRQREASAGFVAAFPDVPQAAVNPYGVNVSLAGCDEEELERTLEMVEAGSFHWVRQAFPWAEIEPQPGRYDWECWDRIVSAIRRHGLEIIAVLDTSPNWAQLHPSGNLHTPPQRVEDFGRFARAFAARYGEEIDYYQIWDEPNLSVRWGDRYVEPAQYARLLREGFIQIKSVDEKAHILAGGLAPNVEEGPLNLNESAFLRGLYEAGGRDFFDIVAVKPYGFETGPDDRRVDPAVLNFSRCQLVRKVMVEHGDEGKAVWAVEFGWNSLPEGWRGKPSIWGEVSEDEQARYAAGAIRRARDEWPWMGVLAWASFRPDVPSDDPHWGFALVDERWELRPVYERSREMAREAPIAHVGCYPADHYTARYEGHWRLSSFGADIGESGDSLVIPFKGTRLDLTVRRGDFWGVLYVTVDGGPANALPRDEEGRSYLILYDPLHRTETVTLAKGLADAEH
ncbi:MAG: beta-galactosidase, partial [Chloroflexota bacterium]|nr:beta-galactosidase [Chloroflexota bacterium]